ncbi:MAG TPA: DUF998 domain-containing protein [Longimicrobium sp.]|nr:DUF998 domain-containing protein [Longimicrobium sp.]
MDAIGMTHARPRPLAHAARADAGVKVLLACGAVAAALYTAMMLLIGLLWNGYSMAGQTVSELSAIGAPTRTLWIVLGTVYSVLVAAFALGVVLLSRHGGALRAAGAVLAVHAVLSFFYPPMHLRGAGLTRTDTLHVVSGIATILLMVLAMAFGAAALGGAFRRFSLSAIALFLVFGTLTGIEAPRVAANLPTPWIGVWERAAIAAFMLWMAMLARALMRGPPPGVEPARPRGG